VPQEFFIAESVRHPQVPAFGNFAGFAASNFEVSLVFDRVFPQVMKKSIFCMPLLAALLLFCSSAFAQEGPLNTDPPKGITVPEIIQKFAAKEKEFKAARDNYTFRQDVRVQTLDGDTVTGEYREVFDVTFDDTGRHLENVVFAPENTLTEILMTPEDLQDIRHTMPFVLTSDEIPDYDILYVGQQQEDELHCYVFDIAPKKIESKRRYFQGRIWVDDQDLQIVKTSGKAVPETHKKNNENLFPKFTTWREQVDGKYWFPAYTKADDTLHFRQGAYQDVHVRDIIKYTDYKRFGSNVVITYEGKQLPQGETQKPPNGQKPQ
jgi:outer membrane lipoprotein-sorting protein